MIKTLLAKLAAPERSGFVHYSGNAEDLEAAAEAAAENGFTVTLQAGSYAGLPVIEYVRLDGPPSISTTTVAAMDAEQGDAADDDGRDGTDD